MFRGLEGQTLRDRWPHDAARGLRGEPKKNAS
jgi:hypothetical protein